MPKTARLRPEHGAKAAAIAWMLQPSTLIREKWPATRQRERLEGLVLVGRNFWVVRRGSPATNAFIMHNGDLPNKELYATKRMVNIKEEGHK